MIFVGNQIFIDILGANNCDLASILVKYVTAHEETNIVLWRCFEKTILKLYLLSSRRHRFGGGLCNLGNTIHYMVLHSPLTVFPWRYELVEEEHLFQQEGEKFFRVSKIYRGL